MDRLREVVKVAEQQLTLLEEASARPEVHRAELAAIALDFVLIALAHASRGGGEELDAFAARVDAYRAGALDVRQHLIELGEDWRCKGCGEDVVGGAVVSGAQSRSPSLELRCASCGRVSAAGLRGRAALKRRFGHLFGPEWAPERNGFVRGS